MRRDSGRSGHLGRTVSDAGFSGTLAAVQTAWSLSDGAVQDILWVNDAAPRAQPVCLTSHEKLKLIPTAAHDYTPAHGHNEM